jgi:hypothetical protein
MNYFEKSDQAITKLSLDIMGQAPRFMAMLDGFVLKGREVAEFPRLAAVFMKQDKVTLAQPDAEILPVIKKVIAQLEQNRETAEKVFTIPTPLLETKYKGCGNGIVTIEKATRKVLDFEYTDSKLRPLAEQNISMTKSAGRTIREDEATITYRANFSSCQVCLF